MEVTSSHEWVKAGALACANSVKPTNGGGRAWTCRMCESAAHRDVVGSVNIHEKGFGEKVAFARKL